MDNYSRFNINAAIESDVANWLKVTYRNRYSFAVTKEPVSEYAGGRQRMFDYAFGAWPTSPLQYPDGSYAGIIATSMNGGMKRTWGIVSIIFWLSILNWLKDGLHTWTERGV